MITFSKLGRFGRLGNQLFQIASTIGVATRHGTSFVFPAWSYQTYFNNILPTGYPPECKIYVEPSSLYTEINLDKQFNWSLEGYFQSWKYFDHCKDLIKYYFHFEKPHFPGVDNVAVHVRRGDYIELSHVHPVLGMDYYRKAFDHFKGEKFTIFSDDIEWCKENFRSTDDIFFVHNDSEIFDFQIMTSHRKFIIANSSFSYWAAYLSGSKDVIAPKEYVVGEERDDRIFPDWIKM